MNRKRCISLLLAMLLLSAIACAAFFTILQAGTGGAKHPLPILMYHHVVADGEEYNSMCVTESRLRADLQWLVEEGYQTVLPRELAAGELPKKPVLITFDDGYRSSYERVYPLLQEYGAKAALSIMVYMQDSSANEFVSWDMCREMEASGLEEIGSHAYRLHNLDGRGGALTPGGTNGVQRKPEETDEEFRLRVLDDLQISYDLIEENLGHAPTLFAYPYGITEPDAEEFIQELFPVTLITKPTDTVFRTADLSLGLHNLPRFNITMDSPPGVQLAPPLSTRFKTGVKVLLGMVS